MNSSTLVQKVWSFCHTLRDDGVGYGDYLEQLTYLLFLKLASITTDPFCTPNSEVGWSEKRAEWAFCTFGSYVLQ